MSTVILATKTKNTIEKANKANANLNLSYYLHNIVINGSKRGCSGFVRNEDTGVCVYLTTEQCPAPNLGFMYRYADNIKDFSGYRNRWTKSLDDLAYRVVEMLLSNPTAQNDRRL